MKLRTSAVLLALAAPAALAQSNTFDLQSNSRSIGRSTYTLAKAKQGFKLSDRSSYHLGGTEADIADDFKLSETYAYLEGSSTNVTNQMHTSYVPNKTRTELIVGMVQANIQESRHLAIKPDFAIMPAYDAGAAQVMLLLATTHPTEKNLYNIVVPSSGGGAAPPDAGQPAAGRPASGNNAYDALWTKGADTTGMLDGKPVALHTYTLTAGKFTWVFFADDANLLMQLNVSMLKTSYIRSRFKLDTPQ